mgnify:CR=1 FL=1
MSTPTGRTTPGRRPPSPTVISRKQEKVELAGLNDRLAAYIDRVRYLENENAGLRVKITSHEETVTREVSNIKGLFETELADARKLLDETSKARARLQIEVDKYKSEAAEYKEKYIRRNKEAEGYEKSLLSAEAQINDLQARLNDAVNERKHYENEYKKLRKEFDALEKQLALLKRQLEDETVARVDLENRLQSMKEELAFKQEVHNQELNESRMRQDITLEEVDGRLQNEYESKLADALHAMRDENDEQIRLTREETEMIFNGKLEELRAMSDKHDGAREAALRELKTLRTRCDDLSSQVSRLGSQNALYESRIKELEARLARETEDHEAAINIRDNEIRRLRAALEDQLSEYRDLLDIKIQLDTEIAAYRKMLESEESRLNISSASEATPGRGGTPRRGTPLRTTAAASRKRKRDTSALQSTSASFSGRGAGAMLHQASASAGYTTKTSAKGDVIIQETSEDGKFIKLHNTSSDKDQALGGWQLRHTAGEEETVFKFHRSANLKAGQDVTVWSMDSGTTHSPPTDLVMKSQSWSTADKMQTLLVSNKDEEMATCDMERSQAYTSITQRSSYSSDDSGYPEEEGSSSWFGRIFRK